MTNQEILRIAIAQSARDFSADASDFEKSKNVVVTSHVSDGASAFSADVQTLVCKLRDFITQNYYTCTVEILA